ncbi:HEPN domain-containing protein [Larkinella sp. VNQ87]|uniref:HEPN domain-containing protein n=1 Tax=Larkinella sp. VNQ87 TaxID=3400921 RepID=UPI003BFCF676
MSREEHIDYWRRQALDDWETVEVLYRGKKYLQSLFWLHLTIEKLCKAVWIANNKDTVPPRIHNLLRLLNNSNVRATEEHTILMVELNRFQLEGRYPNYIADLQTTITSELVVDYMMRSKSLKEWLLSQLPSN